MLYSYNAVVTRVVDGDTVDVRLDLGFKIFHDVRLRLQGIDTPELRGEEYEAGHKAKKFVEEKVLNKDVRIETIRDKKGKYGRYIAKIFYEDICLNDELLKVGMAVESEY